jgi:hypothetical protein
LLILIIETVLSGNCSFGGAGGFFRKEKEK